MTGDYRVSGRVRWQRALLRPLFRSIFRLISRVEITGLEHVPAQGAYLIAINHVSLFEAPLVCAFWPRPPEAMGAVELWHRPGQGQLARLYGGIPVHRGELDRQLIETVLAVLASGYPLLIAPEGSRSHRPGMQRAKPGVAYLISKAGVPVVPVGIVGSTDDFLARGLRFQRPVITMHIGPALKLAPVTGRGADRRETLQANADLVMAHIAALLPEEYRGVYQDHGYLESQTAR
ncbi:MAG: 1-acyl-sn-glycerol-3-phosphate acyltransferase [Anaerolineales bacterium]|nr:1-acyl-sn-glycerol-3-phosphate acyltransferase [Anaerolineales bacterium]